ncbi:hypothetical protein ACFSF3_00240 [Vibrio chagasii]
MRTSIKSKPKGIELEGSYELSVSWSFTANATYTDAVNKVDDKDMAYQP